MTYYAYRIQSEHGATLNFPRMLINGVIASILIGFVSIFLISPLLLRIIYKIEEIPSQKNEKD